MIDKDKILDKVNKLIIMYKNGELGGEVMPEDANPNLEKYSLENYLYFTLPMALNYQRNSYNLWEGANKTANDSTTSFVFNPHEVIKKDFLEVQEALVKYKVALQKNKQTEIWIKLCHTFINLFDGDIRLIFKENDYSVDKVRKFILAHKKDFPYISGTKLVNYWMYVIYQDPENLTVAPDTHVIKSTHKLGLISDKDLEDAHVQDIVIEAWKELLKDTPYKPIDIHTPLWLWSRSGFIPLDESVLNEK